MNMYPILPGQGEHLPMQTIMRLESMIGEDPRLQDAVLRFIQYRYGAASLIYLPRRIAAEALRRPADFLKAARHFVQPEFKL